MSRSQPLASFACLALLLPVQCSIALTSAVDVAAHRLPASLALLSTPLLAMCEGAELCLDAIDGNAAGLIFEGIVLM